MVERQDLLGSQAAREALARIVALALAEDLGEAGDITSTSIFAAGQTAHGSIVSREACVVSGLRAAAEVCRQADAGLDWLPLVEEGDAIPAGAQVARIEGPVVGMLTAERTLLNFLSRLSGVATLTRRYVAAVEGLDSRIAGTRKTMPGLRWPEKQAIVAGGGIPHRMGLYDAVLIKDNHIAAAGGVLAAVARVRERQPAGVALEVEVDNLEQLREALAAGVDRVLLDNMEPEEVSGCVREVAGRAVVEASGGITLENIRRFAEAGAGIISTGAITRDADGIDFSLEISG